MSGVDINIASFKVPIAEVERIVGQALAEDLPWGDVTSDHLIPLDQPGVGRIEARQAGVLAGLPIASLVFRQVDPTLNFEAHCADGIRLQPGERIATITGSLRSLLRGERVALNFLQRLSGIATATDWYVQAVVGTSARIVDTRKTTPGLRALEKYAVRVGGGRNHRYCLSDAVLIKDNHLAALAQRNLDLSRAVRALRDEIPHTTTIEVEAEDLDAVARALAAGVDAILLDNMSVPRLRQAVELVGGRVLTEASGGVTLQSVRAIAETGVDLISVGALTHSVRALDLALEIDG
jgi:nicotinate-nucleotide pyrophosphorylase (carboxylating)